MSRIKGTHSMDDSFENWLQYILADYDKVVFLYHLSEVSCIDLQTILKKEKRKLLLLTDTEAPDFPCNQRMLSEEECRRLLELYFTYSFADRFIFLTDRKVFPWPSAANFVEAGLAESVEILEAMLN